MSEQAQPTRVVPNISLAGRSREAIALWTRAFGAKEIAAYAEGDRIRHGEVEINGGAVFVTDFNMDPQHVFQPTPSIAMHLAVPDGMTWMSRAEAAGCKILTPWRKMPFGGFGRVTDPFGIIWQIATPNDLLLKPQHVQHVTPRGLSSLEYGYMLRASCKASGFRPAAAS